MVGDDQMAAPDGPCRSVPAEFFLVTEGGSRMVKVFQSSLPVAASSEARLPRNAHHWYFGLAASISSAPDRTPTYTRPSTTFGDPVIPARGCSSSLVFQSSSPVCAFTAKTLVRPSPKY